MNIHPHTYVTNTKIYPNESNSTKSKSISVQKNTLILLMLNHETKPNSNDKDR